MGKIHGVFLGSTDALVACLFTNFARNWIYVVWTDHRIKTHI